MKTATRILRIALVVLAVAGITHWAVQNFGPREVAAEDATVENPLAGREHGVVVTYFRSNARCATCIKIESLAEKAVTEGFAAELAEGSVVFRTLNFDQPEYAHFTERYNLAFGTVVVSDYRSGEESQWVDLDEVWQLTEKPDELVALVRGAIRKYLESDA